MKVLMIRDVNKEEWEEFKEEESIQKDGVFNLEYYNVDEIYTYQYKVIEK